MDPQEKREMPDESRPEASRSPAEELPTERGFLVQLTQDTGPTLSCFAGRVEHLESGHRLRFGSFSGFQEAVSKLLAMAKRP